MKAHAVENLTGYPSIFGGRVKTLHPKVFGGILHRRDNEDDRRQAAEYEIPQIDLVIVDLYPFEQTVATPGATEQQIIEKIDIGGISLIRAAAKNYKDVAIVPSVNQYGYILDLLRTQNGCTTLEQRRRLAAEAFNVSSHYDTAIFNYFNRTEGIPAFKQSFTEASATHLRYGENPHQAAVFFGDLSAQFEQLHGKEISYNNMLDMDAAVNLIAEFGDSEPAFVIMKHNNACGVAVRPTLVEAWKDALAGDPVSAFGGVLITNRTVDKATAEKINEIFFEVIMAPGYDDDALAVLETKKNRIILKAKSAARCGKQFRSLLGGVAVQERDAKVGGRDSEVKQATDKAVTADELKDLIFANKIVKHSKSNAIVLAKTACCWPAASARLRAWTRCGRPSRRPSRSVSTCAAPCWPRTLSSRSPTAPKSPTRRVSTPSSSPADRCATRIPSTIATPTAWPWSSPACATSNTKRRHGTLFIPHAGAGHGPRHGQHHHHL